MHKFIEKMIKEREELTGKINRAKNAVENPPYGSDAEGLRMLAEQVKAMDSYLYWLNERIKHEESK